MCMKKLVERWYLKYNARWIFTDAVTNCLNRNWYEYHKEMIAHKEFDVVVIDINGLKHYNDTYGHDKGDEMILVIVNIAKAIFHRSDDYIVRWGGDEFMIITPNTYEIEVMKDMPTTNFSYGIAHHNSGESIDATFKLADRAMYEMKNKFHGISE